MTELNDINPETWAILALGLAFVSLVAITITAMLVEKDRHDNEE